MELTRFSGGGGKRGAMLVLAAEPGAGKTFQARLLPPDTMLIDLEGGTLAIANDVTIDGVHYPRYQGHVLTGIRSWEEFATIATLITGPDMRRKPEEPFSQAMWENARNAHPDIAEAIDKAPIVFIDGLSWASRLAYEWAASQPVTWTVKGQRPVQDTWAVYRLLADEMVRFVRMAQIKAAASKQMIVLTIVLQRDRELGWDYQLHGQKTGEELRGVCDTIIALVELAKVEGGYVLASAAPPGAQRFRAFVCRRDNPWGLPVKDRSSLLDLLEPPRLDLLLAKLQGV